MTTLDYYNQNAQTFVQGTLHADMQEHYAKFLPYLPDHARILDLGCGSGRDTHFFLDKGFNVIPVDGSIEVCRIAQDYLGIPVCCLRFDELAFQNEFDGIWASASLLHVQKAEMPIIMRKIEEALTVGGVLYTSFKYGQGEKNVNGRFFNYYSEHEIEELLCADHLQCVEFWISNDVRPERENERWLNMIVRKTE